jgi:pimeloyl-ACP methyl ester carboxylesterase
MSLPRVPLSLHRLGHAALGRVAPGLAGRIATDVFSSTRTLGTHPDDVLPLGARRFEVPGDPDIRGGYLWGEEGPSALLVHGWATDSSRMHSLVAPLRSLGYRVAAFDAPGHGVSEGNQATMTQFERATGAVVDALGDVRVIVAHSLGSLAALSAVARRPELPVECLVLLSPTSTLPGVLERWSRSDLRLRRPIVERIYEELHRRNGMPLSHWDAIGLGGELTCPILVIHDPEDAVVPYSDAESVVAGLRDARLEPAPGCGHFKILTASAVKDLIGTFTSTHAKGGPTAVR